MNLGAVSTVNADNVGLLLGRRRRILGEQRD